MRAKKIIISSGVLALLLIPFPTLVAPLWDVVVRDEMGAALGSVLVRETYQDYSAQIAGDEQDLYTDHAGHVQFAPRWIWVSGLTRILVSCSSAMALAHASFGPHDTVFAISGAQIGNLEKNGVIEDWTGSPRTIRSVIILRGLGSP